MSIKALNTFSSFWYTPKEEDEESTQEEGDILQVEFQVCGLNGEQMAHVGPGISVNGDDVSINYNSLRALIGFGLKGWRNFENDSGPVKFHKNPAKNMAAMPYELQLELAGVILEASNVGEEERKN